MQLLNMNSIRTLNRFLRFFGTFDKFVTLSLYIRNVVAILADIH